jgi:hypothetical protein
MESRIRKWVVCAGAALCCASVATAQFSDNFESYANGAFTPGGTPNSGGWRQWDTYPLAAGQGPFVNNTANGPVHSGARALGTREAADTIHEFAGFNTGHWDFHIWTYVQGPASATPMSGQQWLVLLNDYTDGAGAANRWATQIAFDPSLAQVTCDNGYSTISGLPQWGSSAPLVYDAWTEVKIDLDIGANLAQVYYNGAPVGDPFVWSAGPFGQDVGAPILDCIDLYANSPSYAVGSGTLEYLYWDDLAIVPHVTAPTNYCTVGTTSLGCSPAITSTGTPSASASSGFTLQCNNIDANQTGLFFYGVTNVGFTPVQWGATGTSFFCVKSPVERMGPMNSGGTTGCTGAYAQDWNAYLFANPGAIGTPRIAGASFDAQVWMRDPPSGKTTILSDALRFVLAP